MQFGLRRATNRSAAHSLSGLNPDAQVALNLALVRVAAWVTPPASLIVLVVSLSTGDTPLLVLSGAAALISATAIWQLATGRPGALVLNLMTAVTLGIVAPFMSHNVSVGLGTGLIVLAMAGVPQVPERYLRLYLSFVSAMWVIHLAIRHVVGGNWPEGIAIGYLAQVVFLIFGMTAMMTMRRQLAHSESRYSYLFAQAPVALWDNDFTAVGRWMNGLREQGIEDLRLYLDRHPEQLRAAIASVVTTDANPEAARLLAARNPADLRGPFPPEIIDVASEHLFLEQFVAMWDGSDSVDLEFRGQKLDGTEFDGVLRSSPTTPGRDLSRMVTAVSDVTRQREVEEELRSAEATSTALLEALPDLLFLCDADGTYRDYHVSPMAPGTRNSATESDLLVPPADFLGKKPHDILPLDLAQQMMITIVTAFETDHVQTFEYDLPINGEDRYWEMRVSPLAGRDQVVVLVRDITDADRARTELERLVQSKDDFIAAISHEIRTPLTGIVGFTHLLHDREHLDPDERHKMIETLVAQSADLTNIVEDLLVAAKADLGRLVFAEVPTDLRAQAAQVLEAWDPEVVRNIEIVGESETCRGDPARVRQVIRNLLSNALRYGGSHIRIELTRTDSTGILTLVDDGPGIPADQVKQVFHPYHRAAPNDGLSAALGIGLPISRTLARLMHGDLTYENDGEDTRFTLSLPLADSTPPVGRSHSAATPIGLLGRSDKQ